MSGSTVVLNQDQLAAYIGAISLGGSLYAANATYTIDLAADLTLTQDIPSITLGSASSLLVLGDNTERANLAALIDGDGVYRGFNVVAGSVTFANLDLSNLRAPAGGSIPGGGAAIDVASGATVSTSGVIFAANQAIGSGAAGGAIFVQQGGSLVITGGSLAGAGAEPGSGVFIDGNASILLSTGALVSGVIADQAGAGLGTGHGTVDVQGGVTLSGADTYTGGTVIGSPGAPATLTLLSSQAAGTGAISLGAAVGNALAIGTGDAPANTIAGFVIGDSIDLLGIGLATSWTLGASNQLVIQAGTATSLTLHLDPLANYAADAVVLSPDGGGGTVLTLVRNQYAIASEADLNAALAAIDIGGAASASGTNYILTFTGGFTLATDMNAINLAGGDTLAIVGGGATLDGAGLYRGFFDYAGAVTISDLTIADAVARGGAGGAGAGPGGGGAGLGGGLFVASAGNVTLANVTFLNDQALGGNGGGAGSGAGGGGGLGGLGGNGAVSRAGGGGGIGVGASGGSVATSSGNGGTGILAGAGPAASGTGTGANHGGSGGANAGGGGAGGVVTTGGSGRGGGGSHSYPGAAGSGGIAGAGNFGGGGGGTGGQAGFGGGAGGGGGLAGWGGGGSGAAGGFEGGSGGAGGAGGGVGAGGDIFVQTGGQLTFSASGILFGGMAQAGSGSLGGGAGTSLAAGIFAQGGGTIVLAPTLGNTLTVADAVGDSAFAGTEAILLNGLGTVVLSAMNAFTGDVTVMSGTLSLQHTGAAGGGAIVFGYGATADLMIGPGDVPTNVLGGFLPGITIDVQGVGTASSATPDGANHLRIAGGGVDVSLTLDPAQILTGETFDVQSDGHGGTYVTASTTGNDHPPHIFGAPANGDDHTPFAPLSGLTVSDLDPGQTETATVAQRTLANGLLSNFGVGAYEPATGTYTVTGTASSVTAAIDALVFTPTAHQVAPGQTVQTGFGVSVTDGTLSAAASETTSVTALNDPPVITGTGTSLPGYFNQPVAIFQGVTIADPDVGATETVTITLSNSLSSAGTDANGVLSGAGLTQTGAGTYTLAGTPDAVSAELDALSFTPIAAAAPGPVFTYASLVVSDGIAAPVKAQWDAVDAGLPAIGGTRPGQVVAENGSIDPFATLMVTDSAGYLIQGVTVTLADAGSPGAPTDANGALSGSGLTRIAAGTYALAIQNTASGDLPSLITSELRRLVFTPVAQPGAVTTQFGLAVFDGTATVDNFDTSVQSVACFRAGTLIQGEMGEIPVELLRIGDRVRTVVAGLRAIRWIGWRVYGAAQVARNRDIRPVLLRAGALADAVPRRDLYLSPQHALWIDGALIPAYLLVNGVSVLDAGEGGVTYFHVELESHDVILADGAPAETFIDHASRRMFRNAAEYARLYPADPAPRVENRAPRLAFGSSLEAARRRIDARAGLRAPYPDPREQAGPLRGNLEVATPTQVAGWAFNPEHPHSPQFLNITVGHTVVAQVLANRFRQDLTDAGIGNGAFAFDLELVAEWNAQPGDALSIIRALDRRLLAHATITSGPAETLSGVAAR